MKLTTYIQIALCLIIAASVGFGVYQTKENTAKKKQIEKMQSQIDTLVKTNATLANKKTYAYAISLNPNVTNKINTTLGSARQIENKFYFQMNGNEIQLTADSTYSK